MSDPTTGSVSVSRSPEDPPDAPGTPGTRGGGGRADAAVILGTLVVLGLVGGVLWWLLVDPATYTRTRQGGVMSEAQFARQFDADGVYVAIAAVAGLLSGLALSWWRRRDPLLTSVLLVLGSVLAAALMVLVGRLLGPGDPGPALRSAAVGARVPVRLTVDAFPVYLVWPLAVLAGDLLVLLNRSDPPTGDPARR